MNPSEMNAFWDNRYAGKEYAYGTAPNEFFREALEKYLREGKLLLPAEGEGRNAVYAAQQGLEVVAFDTSTAGRKKAMKLARAKGVEIRYEVGDFVELPLINETYDAAALIFAHFPIDILSDYHHRIAALIKPGGLVILEGFSKKQPAYQEKNPNAGGPRNIDMLFTEDMIKADFSGFEALLLEEKEVTLYEGKYHRGKSSVIRFIGRKRNGE